MTLKALNPSRLTPDKGGGIVQPVRWKGMLHQVSREEATAELLKVLSWESLAKSQNLAKLLQYICGKYLDGRAGDLKEYNIGVEALGRPADFDPSSNSIVRVELHRLREKLKRYYETDGILDPTVILLEPGNYAPRFIPHSASPLDLSTVRATAPQQGSSLRAGDSGARLQENALIAKRGSFVRLMIPAGALVVVAALILLAAWRGGSAGSERGVLGAAIPAHRLES